MNKTNSLKDDFNKISWAKLKEVFVGIKDVLIFSFILGTLCGIVDLIMSIIISGKIGG